MYADDGFNFSNCQFISEEKDQRLRKGRLSRHDLVMTTRGTIGNVGYYNDNITYEKLRINSGMVIFRADTSRLHPKFLYHFLRSPDFIGQTISMRSGVAQPQFPIRDIKRVELPTPDLAIQTKIASVLSAYDDLIENNRRRMALLEEAARQLYREWFVRLRFPGHEHTRIINGVPEGWERKRRVSAAECVGGGTPSTSDPDCWEDGDVTWVTPTDVTRNKHFVLLDSEKKITEAGLQKSSAKLVPAHAVLMTTPRVGWLFRGCRADGCTNQGFISIVPKETGYSPYLLFHLNERVEEIRAMGSGSTYPEVSRGKFP